jgi:hypothetical protein
VGWNTFQSEDIFFILSISFPYSIPILIKSKKVCWERDNDNGWVVVGW